MTTSSCVSKGCPSPYCVIEVGKCETTLHVHNQLQMELLNKLVYTWNVVACSFSLCTPGCTHAHPV